MRDQRSITGGVTRLIVDALEPVEVEIEHGHRGAFARRAAQRFAEALGEEPAVGQSGERIVEGLLGELGLESFPLADVGHVEQVAVLSRRCGSGCPSCAPSGLSPAPVRKRRSPATRRGAGVEIGGEPGRHLTVVGVKQLSERQETQGRLVEVEQAEQGRVGGDGDPVAGLLDQDHSTGCVMERRLVELAVRGRARRS